MRSLRAVLACAVVAAGLAMPAASAEPVLHARGRVLDDTGRPVRGAIVRLTPMTDTFGFPLLVTCSNVPSAPDPCRSVSTYAVTGADGRYALPVRNSTLVGRQGRKALTIFGGGTRELAGAYTATDVYWARQDLRIPDLRLWQGAKPQVETYQPNVVRVRRTPLPAAFGSPTTATPSVHLLQGTYGVWKYADEAGDHYSDARTVETGTTGAREVAVATLPFGYRVTYHSRAVRIAAPAVKPVSRGAACATYGQHDALLPLAGCRYTDGRLGDPVDPRYAWASGKACRYPSATCPHPGWVRFDLKAPQAVQAVVVRGCTPKPTALGTLPAEVSADGLVWAPLVAANPWSDLEYAPPTPARYVRVDLRQCAFPATEVSVFGPA